MVNLQHPIYLELQATTDKILATMGLKRLGREDRRKAWKEGRPSGILYHYTGGLNYERSLRWFLDPSYGNKESSAHVLVLDRLRPYKIGDIWVNDLSARALELFPVPTLILADFDLGTWHGNWTCDICIGIENRNAGYSAKLIDLNTMGKRGVKVRGKVWEDYTNEQLMCNYNLTWLINEMVNDTLDACKLLGHSAVWAIKSDPGPLFPLEFIRIALNGKPMTDAKEWVSFFTSAMPNHEHVDGEVIVSDGASDLYRGPEDFPDITVEIEKVPTGKFETATLLYLLGYNTRSFVYSKERISEAVLGFQKSTKAYEKVGKPERVLKPDGVFGPKTKAGLIARLAELGIKHASVG